MARTSGKIGCAVIGYGATHNFGNMHSTWIEDSPDLELIAICDRDTDRATAAARDFPQAQFYSDTKDLWADQDVEMVTIVTPNFTHCDLTTEAFAHGRHVLVENAMCVTVEQSTKMIEAGAKAGRMLCVHHNRRHDGNYRLIREIVDSGTIGEIFHIELTPGQYAHPFPGNTDSWWADRSRSGGGWFYYGAQAIDWILDLVDSPMTGVTGFSTKRVWTDITFEDQVMAIMHFKNGVYANFCESHIRAAPQPFWRILGTKGAIVDSGKDATKGYQEVVKHPSSGSLTLYQVKDGETVTEELAYKDSDWDEFYKDIARHIQAGAPVPIAGEVGRRVMSVLKTAEKSAASGKTEMPPFA